MKEQKKKVEKEAIKNQFLEKTETKVKKAIKDAYLYDCRSRTV